MSDILILIQVSLVHYPKEACSIVGELRNFCYSNRYIGSNIIIFPSSQLSNREPLTEKSHIKMATTIKINREGQTGRKPSLSIN